MEWYWWVTCTIVVLVGLDEWMRISYQLKAWRNGAVNPHIRMSRPFGLPNLRRMLIAAKHDCTIESGLSIYRIVKKKTFLMQFTFDMEFHTKDPENIKALLATQFQDFDLGRREETLGYFLGRGIFTLSGQGWKHSRTLLRPQFSRQMVSQLESVDHHVSKAIELVKNSKRVNFQELFHKLTMDTATEFLFGESAGTLDNQGVVRNGISSVQFVEDYKTCVKYSLVRFTLGPLYWMFAPKQFKLAIQRCRNFVDYFVHQALDATATTEKDTPQGYVFSVELAKATRDPVVIRDQLFNILVAGHDTTGNLLGYVVWYLAKYPEVWKKLGEVVREQYSSADSEITFENIKKCRYLSWVFSEVLRLHPIVPRNLRYAVKDTFLPRGGGPDESQPMFVPKGSAICYHTFGLQRDLEIWGPDADEFRPERWNNPNVQPWSYLPFNGGPRICLGQQFALTEASVTIIRFVQNFSHLEVDTTAEVPVNEAALTSQVAGGVWGTAY